MNSPVTARRVAGSVAASAAMLWLAQPPLAWWPLACIALVPMLRLTDPRNVIGRRGYAILWAGWTIYWLVSLQGLRHAHPVMYACWIALSAYLAVYPVAFVALVRRITDRQLPRHPIPLILVAPLAWVTIELLRNYLLTGISAAMLGHTMADVPTMIQVADLGGTYAVGVVIVTINVAATFLWAVLRREQSVREGVPTCIATALLVVATVAYGQFRLSQPLGKELATFALIQRDEPVEYQQSVEREVEIFRNYARQSAESVAAAGRAVDVVVWPESMFTAGAPWMIASENMALPPDVPLSASEFRLAIDERQAAFSERAIYVQESIAAAAASDRRPDLLVGSGVVQYAEFPKVYSGVVHVRDGGDVGGWYGKTHLVMFGEYVPIAPYVPGIRALVPPGMGIQTGPGATRFRIDYTTVAANICIETAVERVTVRQLASLHRRGELADVVVTVTNDGWFDRSSVLEHHLRCAQLVAVGARRPILSAANGGPTAWIDSRGQIVDRLPTGANGAVIATPLRDRRTSWYLRIGDWPVRLAAIVTLFLTLPTRRRSPQQHTAV